MENLFKLAAAVLFGLAAYFYWVDYKDAAFAAGVLGAVSFFLNVRAQSKRRLNERDRALEYSSDDQLDGKEADHEPPVENEREFEAHLGK